MDSTDSLLSNVRINLSSNRSLLLGFLCLVLLPTSPNRTRDTDGGIASADDTEDHGQRKALNGRNVLNKRKDIYHNNAEQCTDIGVQRARDGLADALSTIFSIGILSPYSSLFSRIRS